MTNSQTPHLTGSTKALLRFHLDAVMNEIEAVRPLSAAITTAKDSIRRADAYIAMRFANRVVAPRQDGAGAAVDLATVVRGA